MSLQTKTIETHREVLRGLSTKVGQNLSFLLHPDDAWQPTDFLPDLTAPDWYDQLLEFREPAKGLTDEVLVVLVGDMVTEEALPSYSVSLNNIAEDSEGTSDAPWAQWLRGWTAEENRHGDLLNAFLRLTGRVEMKSVERTVHHLIANGFNPKAQSDPYSGLVYTAFQERATKVSHSNVGKLASAEGNETLNSICRRIAADEARHEAFYTRMMAGVLEQDPEGGTITASKMLRATIAMPGRLMYDGKDPDLFDHFSIVAQRLGVYTVRDYANIVRHLVDTWGIANLNLAGKAARAQEFLCRNAERIDSLSERVTDAISQAPRTRFSWIHDRLA